MLETIFKKLNGKNQDFNKKELDILEGFIKDEIVTKKDNSFTLNSLYKVGFVKLENKFAHLLDLQNEFKNIKLDFEYLNGAYDGDLVIAKRVFNPKSKIKAKVLKVIQSSESELLVYVKEKKLFTIKESITLDKTTKSFAEYKDGDILLISSKSFEVLKVIGNFLDPKVDEIISLYLYNEQNRLNKSDEETALMNDTNKRVDLTHLPFCTIDPSSAKDHDDAIYYDKKEHIIYVAIADVSFFVKEGSSLDKEAFTKSTSIYLPQKVLPMLPSSLSEELCSLKEGVNRYAYVFKIFLDKNNSVRKSQNFEALINSHKKFAYETIDLFLEDKIKASSSIEEEIFEYIKPLYEISKNIRFKRLKTGYDFRTNEYRQVLDKNLELQSIVVESSTASHALVEECMLLANIEASKKINTLGIYRIHEEPSFSNISKLVDDVNILGLKVKVGNSVHDTIQKIQEKARNTSLLAEVDELIIQAQTQAKYSSKNLGHFGLGFKSYSHFTSPIRRYSDLVLHRMLKTKQIPSLIVDICEHISVQERKVNLLVWDLEARKYARWAQNHIGEEFKAQIVDAERGIAKFCDVMPNLRVFIDNFTGQKLFLKIKVIIKSSDIITKRIEASIKH